MSTPVKTTAQSSQTINGPISATQVDLGQETPPAAPEGVLGCISNICGSDRITAQHIHSEVPNLGINQNQGILNLPIHDWPLTCMFQVSAVTCIECAFRSCFNLRPESLLNGSFYSALFITSGWNNCGCNLAMVIRADRSEIGQGEDNWE